MSNGSTYINCFISKQLKSLEIVKEWVDSLQEMRLFWDTNKIRIKDYNL